nr:hypothetical protein [Micromonospora sp. DSM 115978]
MIPVVAMVVFWLILLVAGYRAMKAAEPVVRAFFAGINRADHEFVRAQMLPQSARRLTAESLAEDFPEPIERVAIVTMHTTKLRSVDGRTTGLGKVLVRVDYRQGSSADYVLLMAREDGAWKVDKWLEGELFDMIDYKLN